MYIAAIKHLIAKGDYRLTFHAEVERDADAVTAEEIEEALLSDNAEIIEDYPNDPRGPSCLILGFTNTGAAIHIVCGVVDSGLEVIVTVYRPDPEEWVKWRIRKERIS